MSSAILLNFVDYILEKKLNVDVLTMHYDFYILPLLNPDGFEYSITRKFYWSPNRKVYFPKTACPKNVTACGISLSRNWFLSPDIGKLLLFFTRHFLVRDEECDPVYSGSKSLSEEETSGLAKFLDSIALEMLAFINVRGFENLVTIPYGYSNQHCNNYPVLMDILSSVHDRVNAEHNKTFFYGTASSFFYNFTGNVADWVKKKLNTPIVYTIYMNSAHYVLPNAEEVGPRTDELSTMMKEIVLLAGNIYSPLFNSQARHFIQIFVITIHISNILLIAILNEFVFI
ncbi:carboxypeptidase O-like [Helicoverpa armigera]|uniref:carboxypeptidase O-like n=1 Tax=Helicoverpa armigera TaxID=29058 RepID=UPI0030838264